MKCHLCDRNGPSEIGGEKGIRTLGTVSRTHAFQACSFNHSDISPSLESTTCERSPTDYRTRRRALASFRDLVCIQLLESAQDERPQKLCKTSECVATTYGDFVELSSRFAGQAAGVQGSGRERRLQGSSRTW